MREKPLGYWRFSALLPTRYEIAELVIMEKPLTDLLKKLSAV
jgi:hypothetical protein